MGTHKLVVGAIPLFFVVVGLASATSGVLTPADGSDPVGGALLILVGLTLFASLWLVGWWGASSRAEA